MWLKPNADVGDILSIWHYALSVDGYQYVTGNLGFKCATLPNRKLRIFDRRGSGRVPSKNCGATSSTNKGGGTTLE